MFSGFFWPLLQRIAYSIPSVVSTLHTLPLLTPVLVLVAGFITFSILSSTVFAKGSTFTPLRPSISPSVFGTNPALKAGRTAVVVGGGISGVGAAWALEKDGWEVVVVEAEDVLGGHTTTLPLPDGYTCDPGFQILNPLHYVALLEWFADIGAKSGIPISLRETENSLSVSSWAQQPNNPNSNSSSNGGGWASCASYTGLLSILMARGKRFITMMLDMRRFHAQAESILDGPDMSVASFVSAYKYSDPFLNDYLVPCVASLWSCTPEGAAACSIHFVIRFFANHHMLTIFARPVWYTIVGGSSTYLKAYQAITQAQIRTSTRVASLSALPRPVYDEEGYAWEVQTTDGDRIQAHAVVLATHSSTSKAILEASAASLQTRIGVSRMHGALSVLSKLPYYASRVYVHTDASLMPPDRALWASWNSVSLPSGDTVCSYYWNKLQAPDYPHGDIFVTVVPHACSDAALPDPKLCIRDAPFDWEHPAMDVEAVAARQVADAMLQHPRSGLVLAGAWLGNGFHEAGFESGLRAAFLLRRS